MERDQEGLDPELDIKQKSRPNLRTRQRLIMYAFLWAVCLSTIGGLVWSIYWTFRHLDQMMTWIESKGTVGLVAYGTIGSIVTLPASVAGVAFITRRVYKNSDGKLRWVYGTATYFIVIFIYAAVTIPLMRMWFPTVWRHTKLISLFYEIRIITFLISSGLLLYAFKQKAQFLFGATEVLVAIIANLALLGRLDLPNSNLANIPSQDWIGIAVFTYLLSRGVGNVVDGATSLKEKYQERARSWLQDN